MKQSPMACTEGLHVQVTIFLRDYRHHNLSDINPLRLTIAAHSEMNFKGICDCLIWRVVSC